MAVGFINEPDQLGFEFTGGTMLSAGCRKRCGQELKDGTEMIATQTEIGMPFRLGAGTVLASVLAAQGAPCFAVEAAPSLGSVVGLSGNLGVTERVEVSRKPDG